VWGEGGGGAQYKSLKKLHVFAHLGDFHYLKGVWVIGGGGQDTFGIIRGRCPTDRDLTSWNVLEKQVGWGRPCKIGLPRCCVKFQSWDTYVQYNGAEPHCTGGEVGQGGGQGGEGLEKPWRSNAEHLHGSRFVLPAIASSLKTVEIFPIFPYLCPEQQMLDAQLHV
jgi:hypothetical protein